MNFYSPWGDVPLATETFGQLDLYEPAEVLAKRPVAVGLSGLRNVGKSTAARILAQEFGFVPIHAFEAGKFASERWFEHITGSKELAHRMVWGDLKDKPSPYLPGDASPRVFMERFGHFMGVDMGVDWTLALEVQRARRLSPGKPIVVESVVYEAPWFREAGGVVWRLRRPGFQSPAGEKSDSAQETLTVDAEIEASTIEELSTKIREAAKVLLADAA